MTNDIFIIYLCDIDKTPDSGQCAGVVSQRDSLMESLFDLANVSTKPPGMAEAAASGVATGQRYLRAMR